LLPFDGKGDEAMVEKLIIGVGGMGVNFVNQFALGSLRTGFANMRMDTCRKKLEGFVAEENLPLGQTDWFEWDKGAGGDPAVGRRAAEESEVEIVARLKGIQRLYLVMGAGGTGSGAGPVVASLAKQSGVPFVAAFMVKPFGFEGPHRLMNEEDALRMLGTSADLALEFSNERLYGQSILRSIAVPADLAEKAGERFVLGNELGYFSACGRRANERLAQAIRLIDAASSGELGLRRDPLFAVLGGEEEAWWGMGSGMIGPRGLFEAVARASYWPLRKGRDFGKGKIRPKEETGEIPGLVGRLFGRDIPTDIRVQHEPFLGQKIRVNLVCLR
jgi:hypothetical protein